MATPPAPESKSPPPGASNSAIEYCYMFEANRSPTHQLDALLRAIGQHIVQTIGDKSVAHLTPEKLAAFYKAVGGDYDSLFMETPRESISYMWQVTGCQHSLQPTDDIYARPSIPALTPRGFSRWESLEILLGPEEHVPFLQYAVKNWNLKHPETGVEFPKVLPKEVFPAEADEDVDRWHKSCADKLRKEATANAANAANAPKVAASADKEDKEEKDAPKTEPPPEPKVSYVHVRNPFPNPPRQRPDVTYVHVQGPGRQGTTRGTRHSPDKYRQEPQADDHSRRRSFSDYTMPPGPDVPPYIPGATYLDPNLKRPQPHRRHSQPRHYSSDSADEEDLIPPSRMKRRPEVVPDSPPSVRRFVSPSRPGGTPSGSPPYRHRPEARPEDVRRRSAASPSIRDKISEKVSNIFPNGKVPERPRHPRQHSYSNEMRGRRSREHIPPSRLTRSYSDLESDHSSGPESSGEDFRRRPRTRDERDRERDRERFRERERGRPREYERDREDGRRERQYMRRPEVERRTSSHADADRRREHAGWDPRDREQPREPRKRWEKRVSPEGRGASPTTGVSGRRYPEPAYT